MSTETQVMLEVVKKIVDSGAIQIRDVDAGEEPFLYSSGNRGPGYIMIKGLCGQPEILKSLIRELANKVHKEIGNDIDFVDGNVTGGMLPGWELRNCLSELRGEEIPYVYLRGSRKEGGHNELITGDLDNPRINKDMNVIIVEELVNYGATTMNAIKVFREAGYTANHAACILNYAHEDTMKNLAELDVKLVSLVTLPQILEVAEEHSLINKKKIQSYRAFLKDSIKWQIEHGLAVPEEQAKEALTRGYNMAKLSRDQALAAGVPQSKLDADVVYWKAVEKVKPDPTVFIALDYNNSREIIEKMRLFSRVNGPYGYKLNLDSVLSLDSSGVSPYKIIHRLKGTGKPVFVDLKMWNGIRTMSNIVQKCIDAQVDIVNVYPHVGRAALKELVALTRGTKTKLFVLTVLTHYDDHYCQEIYGRDLRDCVRRFAEMAHESRADGIILPPTCLDVVKDLDLIKLCPGIRPDKGDASNNQIQICTPQEALDGGADYLVIGSPITKSEDPSRELEEILNTLV